MEVGLQLVEVVRQCLTTSSLRFMSNQTRKGVFEAVEDYPTSHYPYFFITLRIFTAVIAMNYQLPFENIFGGVFALSRQRLLKSLLGLGR